MANINWMLLDSDICTLDMTVRSTNCLRAENIDTVRELCKKTERDLIITPNLGRRSLNEIKQTLANHGLELNKEYPMRDALDKDSPENYDLKLAETLEFLSSDINDAFSKTIRMHIERLGAQINKSFEKYYFRLKQLENTVATSSKLDIDLKKHTDMHNEAQELLKRTADICKEVKGACHNVIADCKDQIMLMFNANQEETNKHTALLNQHREKVAQEFKYFWEHRREELKGMVLEIIEDREHRIYTNIQGKKELHST